VISLALQWYQRLVGPYLELVGVPCLGGTVIRLLLVIVHRGGEEAWRVGARICGRQANHGGYGHQAL
jgi:hypothetical protein